MHQISGQRRYDPPSVSSGGILADVMGLGKTLTMLSAIVHSMDEAIHFEILPEGGTTEDHVPLKSRATLVVVPSARKYMHPHACRNEITNSIRDHAGLEVRDSNVRYRFYTPSPPKRPNPFARHIAENCLKTATFHGNDREHDPQALATFDIIFTTFSTLMKDYQNARVLHRLKWFRVILDEGKTIIAGRNHNKSRRSSANSGLSSLGS